MMVPDTRLLCQGSSRSHGAGTSNPLTTPLSLKVFSQAFWAENLKVGIPPCPPQARETGTLWQIGFPALEAVHILAILRGFLQF